MNKIVLQTISAIVFVFATVNISYADDNACPCVAECKKRYDKSLKIGMTQETARYILGTCVLEKCYNYTAEKK